MTHWGCHAMQGLSVLCFAMIGLVGCGGELLGPDADDPEPGTPDPSGNQTAQTAFERDLAPKLAVCTGCHQPDTPAGIIDLTDIWSHIDAPSEQIDMPLIEPGNHLQSYLWHKVAGTQGVVGGLGQRMPVDILWPDEDVELLARWIDLGLPR